MSKMKFEISRTILRRATLSILAFAFFLAAAGCGGYSAPGGGGNSPSIASLTPSSGPAGTSVAIYGSNFGATQGTSKVTFNGIAAKPTGWSATTITAQVPAGATTGNVVVTVGGMPSNGATFMVTTTTSASTWTYVQDSLITVCSPSASSCTFGLDITPTVAGSVSIIAISTTNNVTITSASGGGGTWQLCPASSCHVFLSGFRNMDYAYSFNVAAGTNSVTVNLSGSSGAIFGANFLEVLPPPGSTASFDTAGISSSSSCSGSCTAVGLTTSATDVIIQSMHANSPANWNAWSSPYVTLPQAEGMYLNAPPGTIAAPTVHVTATGAVFDAIAFKSTAGTFSAPVQYSPISPVNFTTFAGVGCGPSCSLTIPATGTGHLLFLQAGDVVNAHINSVSGGGTWVVAGCPTITLSPNQNLSCAYVLSSTAGTTSLNVTMSGSGSMFFSVWEMATTGTSFTVDAQGTATNGASHFPAGVTLPLTPGANDVIFQAIFVPGGESGTSYYPLPLIKGAGGGNQLVTNDAGQAVRLNTNDNTPPVYVNAQNNATAVTAIAFRSAAGNLPASPTGLAAVVH
jgi:hypothetical protein